MTTRPIISNFVTVSISAAFAVCATAGHAAGVDAGTLIENTATATYDTGDGPETVDSNTVTVKVDELLDVTVTSLDSSAIAVTPGETVLTFEVTNQGNGPEAFTLTANPAVAGNDFDTTVDAIAVDTNGNGTYDPGVDEILTAPETTAVLDPDQAITVFVIVTVPDGVTDTQESDVELTADAVTGTGTPGTTFAGEGVDGGDAIVGSTTASATAVGSLIAQILAVDLIKAASILDPFGGTSAVPESVITYTLDATVSGTGSIDNFVVTDAIPAGTTYVAGTLTLDSSPLTDASGDDAGEADAAGISVDLGTVVGGTSHSITFDVSIN